MGFAEKENTYMAFQPTNRTGNIFPVHLDLRQRVGTSRLLRWAIEAPQNVDADFAEQLKPSVGDFRPQMLLSLLSFCYSTGCYGSEDIEQAIRNDRSVRYICARTYPEAKVIRRFRRNYRGLLDQCLAYVLRRAAIHMSGGEDDRLAPELDQQVISATREKVELAVILDRSAGD